MINRNQFCPFLTGKYFKSCSVSREVYVPSVFELGEYCTSNRHTLCPFYTKRMAHDSRPAASRVLVGAGNKY